MKASSITLFIFISVFKLLAQPDLYPDMKLHDLDTVISPPGPVDSLGYVFEVAGKYDLNINTRIGQALEGMPSIVEYTKYLYPSLADSISVERGEGVFDENGNIIYSSRYAWNPEAGEWKISEKRESYYDALGRDTSRLIYQHNMQDNRMELVYKWSAKYNESGDVTFNKHYSFYMQSNTSVETTWEYTYNHQGSLLTTDHYFQDSEMVDRYKISSLEQIYDENNNRTSREMYGRDSKDTWIGLERMEWDYDPAGRKIKELTYDWDEDEGAWHYKRKSEYSIDNSDHVKTETIFIFDTDTDSWKLNRQIDYDHDLRGNRLSKSVHEYDHDSREWIGAYKFDYTFDGEDREIGSIQYDWDRSLGIWIPLFNKQISYGAVNFMASYYWSTDLNEWIGDWKRETLYNMYGDYYLDAYYEWDNINSAWSVKSGIKWDRLYNTNNHEVEAIGYNWDPDFLNWVPGGKFEWIYNNEQDLIRSADYAWDQNRQDWNLYSKTFYNYRKGFVTGIPEEEQDDIMIYPNPARSFLVIEGIEDLISIDIFSTTGELLLRKMKPQDRFDISFLPNGIYIIIIRETGNILITRKIVKQ